MSKLDELNADEQSRIDDMFCNGGKVSEVEKQMARLNKLITSKKADRVSDNESEFASFERAATIAGVSVPEVFQNIIALKQARLMHLLKLPKDNININYESIENNLDDLAAYYILFAAYVNSITAGQ